MLFIIKSRVVKIQSPPLKLNRKVVIWNKPAFFAIGKMATVSLTWGNAEEKEMVVSLESAIHFFFFFFFFWFYQKYLIKYIWFYPFFSQFGSQSHPYFFNFPLPCYLLRSAAYTSPPGHSWDLAIPREMRLLQAASSHLCNRNSRLLRGVLVQCSFSRCWVLPPPPEWRANYVTPTWGQTQPLAEAGFETPSLGA